MALSDLEIGDEELEVARWLEESGRRRASKVWLEQLTDNRPVTQSHREVQPVEERTWHRYVSQPSSLSLLALLAASYLIYFFADVQLQIELMRRIVVFVFG